MSLVLSFDLQMHCKFGILQKCVLDCLIFRVLGFQLCMIWNGFVLKLLLKGKKSFAMCFFAKSRLSCSRI